MVDLDDNIYRYNVLCLKSNWTHLPRGTGHIRDSYCETLIIRVNSNESERFISITLTCNLRFADDIKQLVPTRVSNRCLSNRSAIQFRLYCSQGRELSSSVLTSCLICLRTSWYLSVIMAAEGCLCKLVIFKPLVFFRPPVLH